MSGTAHRLGLAGNPLKLVATPRVETYLPASGCIEALAAEIAAEAAGLSRSICSGSEARLARMARIHCHMLEAPAVIDPRVTVAGCRLNVSVDSGRLVGKDGDPHN